MKVSKATIIRTVCLLLAIINSGLQLFGKSPITFITDDMVGEIVSYIFVVATAAVAWWKNNSFTKAAIAGDDLMKTLKKDERTCSNESAPSK